MPGTSPPDPSDADEMELRVDGQTVHLTHLGKPFWPELGLTRRGVVAYYLSVAPHLLPHLRDRSLSMHRFPDGPGGEAFFQKDWRDATPPFVQTTTVYSESKNGVTRYVMANNLATLAWLANLADLEMHPWYSRVSCEGETLGLDFSTPRALEASALSYPDFLVFDLDPHIYPKGARTEGKPPLSREGFAAVVRAALLLHEHLKEMGLPSAPKTSGKGVVHVFVPLVRNVTYEETRAAARSIASRLVARHPDLLTIESKPQAQLGRVLIDVNQNVRGKTLAAAYSLRPTPQATVSTPLGWEELPRAYPTDFTISNIGERLKRRGDLWVRMLKRRADLRAQMGM